MDVLYRFCRRGEGLANEDCRHSLKRFAWVIDGATDVFNRNALKVEHEVSWYVHRLSTELERICTTQPDQSLQFILRTAVSNLYTQLNTNGRLDQYPEYELPTFAIAMVAEENGVLHYLK